MSHFKSLKGDNWEYEEFGNGSEPLLAFHGFDNHSSDFKGLEPALGKRFKIISFNLPYHRSSESGAGIMEGEPQHPTPDSLLTKDDLKELVETCLAQNSVKTFSLMGYSLGGRIVLQLISLFTDRINTVILFAPDGIRNNWENSFITKTSFGKMVYQRIINNPSRLFKIVTLLKTIKLINPKLSDFVHNQLSTREKRQLVWDVSRYLQNIKPDVSNIQRIINTNKINIHLFFGKYDSIIPPSIGKRFVRGLNNKSVLHIVESGHNLVREKMNAELIDVL